MPKYPTEIHLNSKFPQALISLVLVLSYSLHFLLKNQLSLQSRIVLLSHISNLARIIQIKLEICPVQNYARVFKGFGPLWTMRNRVSAIFELIGPSWKSKKWEFSPKYSVFFLVFFFWCNLFPTHSRIFFWLSFCKRGVIVDNIKE